jgi:hypothetical protein
MNRTFYITGSVFCGECGHFLVPELLRDAKGGLTGEVIVRKHAKHCSLADKAAKIRLPQVEVLEVQAA